MKKILLVVLFVGCNVDVHITNNAKRNRKVIKQYGVGNKIINKDSQVIKDSVK